MTVIRRPAAGHLREQIGHPVHAPAPGRLELVEDPPRPAHGVAVGAHELLPPAALLGDQAGPLQHRDVLLHRGEAHRVDVGESRHRRLAPDAAVQDVAARGVGQCVEQAVHLLVGQLTYNHSVVGYRSAYAASFCSWRAGVISTTSHARPTRRISRIVIADRSSSHQRRPCAAERGKAW